MSFENDIDDLHRPKTEVLQQLTTTTATTFRATSTFVTELTRCDAATSYFTGWLF